MDPKETQTKDSQEQEAPQETKEEQSNQEVQEEQTQEDPNARIALDIYNNLQDPSKAKDIIKYLAAKAGVEVSDGTSPRAATKQTLENLKEGVDPQLHFLIDGLKPAIEKLINQQIENAVNPVKQAQLQDKQDIVMSQINMAYDTMRSKYKDFDKHENKMNRIAEDFPYKPGGDMVKYLDNLYKLSTMDIKEGEAVKNAVQKINKNAQKTNVQSAETAENTVQTGSKLPSLREAVLAGVKGIKLQ